MENPFQLSISTDELKADEAVKLFSNVFSEFKILLNPGHTFLNGARGSGKTMMFRLMRPDCQMLMKSCKFTEIDFLGVYIGIKDTHLKKSDLGFLKNRHAESIINEHLLVSHFATKIFSQFATENLEEDSALLDQFRVIFKEQFIQRLEECGWTNPGNISEITSIKDGFKIMAEITNKILESFSIFERSIIENFDKISYKGALLSYSVFLFPVINEIKKLKCLPSAPVYLMIDDADNLNTIQKRILNSWISTRHISLICFKVSTQLNYNQFRTLYGDRIETPHDYSEINIADRYTTSSRGFYRERVIEVVKKRLEFAGISDPDPYKYFPEDIDQEKKIKEIEIKYKAEEIAKGRNEKQAYDFAYRYSRPDFIRDDIKGNRNSYSYAGFDQLVHISSGNMRQFIEPAKIMFDNMRTLYEAEESKPVSSITPKIQNEVIREYSTKEFYGEFENLLKTTKDSLQDEEKRGSDSDGQIVEELKKEKKNIEKLKNLIEVLGNTFKHILISAASERRVFSVAVQDEPNEELDKILCLGVELGYLQKYVIGNKYGTGKAQLYILNRILAPHFGLDPSSFAGYKFVNSEELISAINNPNYLIAKIRDKGIDSVFDKDQPTLFKVEDYE